MKTDGKSIEAAAAAHGDRILDEQVRALHRTASVALNVALVGAFTLCGVLLYIDAQSTRVVAIWLGFVVADVAVRQGLGLRFRAVPPPPADWRPWARRFTAATVAGGLVWGLAPSS